MDTRKIPQDAYERLDNGFNCSEAIFTAFLEAEGKSKDLMKLATPFGAGIGKMRDLCGILNGGLMVLGMHFGRTDNSDADKKIECYQIAADYYKWFESNFGCKCSDIVKGEFTGHNDDCLSIVKKAAEYIINVIEAK